MKNYTYKKIKNKIYSEGVRQVEAYFKIAYDLSLDEFTDKFKIRLKSRPHSYYLIALHFFRLFDFNYLKYDQYFTELKKLIDDAIISKSVEDIKLFDVKLSLKLDEIIKKYGWFDLISLHSDIIELRDNNILKLIDNYIDSLDVYSYEKYKWIVDNYGTINHKNHRKFDTPHLDLLFPEETEDFLELIKLNFIQILIKQTCKQLKRKPIIDTNVSYFEENSSMASIFYDKKNVLILNEYLKEQKENGENFNNAFFNRVLYILLSSKLDDKDIIKSAKRFKTRYREEIERVYNEVIKIDPNSVSTSLVDEDFITFSKKYEKRIILNHS